ncbi:unnamed protein product [Peronospora farinosa]|uniref:Uncharacterized protein n=1 Tax=Peronospora farinosa TaxID=134698 RepID=A0AAV0T289_9STRA|nr:unnamed protein product [Peronospora farinosa]
MSTQRERIAIFLECNASQSNTSTHMAWIDLGHCGSTSPDWSPNAMRADRPDNDDGRPTLSTVFTPKIEVLSVGPSSALGHYQCSQHASWPPYSHTQGRGTQPSGSSLCYIASTDSLASCVGRRVGSRELSAISSHAAAALHTVDMAILCSFVAMRLQVQLRAPLSEFRVCARMATPSA